MKNHEPKLHQFSLSHATLSAKSWGDESKPKILALHGWLDNAASFDFIGPILAEKYYVLALDLVGHGKSSHRPSGIYSIWDYVREVYELLTHLDWQAFSIIGHSMGTTVGMLLTASMKDAVQQFICIEGLGPITTNPELCAEQFANALVETKKSFQTRNEPIYPDKEEMIKLRMNAVTGKISYRAAKALVDHATIEHPKGGFTWLSDWRLRFPSLLRLTEEQCKSFFQAINVPVLLILAEQGIFSEKLFADSKYKSRIDYIKHVRSDMLAGGHHLHMEEQAGEVARLCLEFLNK